MVSLFLRVWNSGITISATRRILGYLPADIDSSERVQALDLLRMRQSLTGVFLSRDHGTNEDYYDIDRSGSITAVDLLRWRQLWFGSAAATQVWQGAEMNSPRPAQCCP